MTDENPNEPAKKMRNLIGGGKFSAIARLPKKDDPAASFLPNLPKKNDAKTDAPPAAEKVAPAKKKFALPAKKAALPTPPKPARVSTPMKLNFGPPFWTVASAISLTVNVVLLIVLLALVSNLNKLNAGGILNLGNSVLGGLFSNFEKMDRASITTNVVVNTTIPVKFDLQLNQQTNVVLSEDVTINNALVTVNTGGLNITRANTTIVLPQGTTLPVVLNLSVPVDTTVPVTLNVPVNIPLKDTELHVPFAGLQDVIRPLYCLVNSAATNLDGQPICR